MGCISVQMVNWTYQIFGEISCTTLWLNALKMEAEGSDDTNVTFYLHSRHFPYLISSNIPTNYINILGYLCTYLKQCGHSFALCCLFFLFSKDHGNILIFLKYLRLTTEMYHPVYSILSTLCRRLEWFRNNFA